MKRLVIGDIHGSLKATKQVLERANFNPEIDMLIGLGDYVDGWNESYEVVSYLMNLPNFKGVLGNHDCFSEDTEALTDSGWKSYKELTLNDKVLSLDTDTNTLCWDNINSIIVKEVDEDLYHYENIHIDMLLTGSHRVLHQKRVRKGTGSYRYEKMKNLKGRVIIPTGGLCQKSGIPLTDDEIRFVAWILTDGSLNSQGDRNYYHIYQSKEPTKTHIRELLKRLKYSFNENERKRNIKEVCERELITEPLPETTFSVSAEDSQRIKEFFPEKYPFPTFLADMDNRQFNIFLHEVILGDGSYCGKKESNTAVLYGQKPFLDAIQILCVQNNKRAVVVMDNRGDYRLNISDYTSTCFDVEDKIKKVPYSGKVWCLSVPKTNFFVRRNGKPFFSGNCWLLDYLSYGAIPHIWTSQGGQATLDSYQGFLGEPNVEEHRKFLSSLPYYLEIDDKLFVHGGVYISENGIDLRALSGERLMWDRVLFTNVIYNKYEFNNAFKHKLNLHPYSELYLGHTTTQNAKPDFTPIAHNNIYLLDQGGGWDGKLTAMDIDTKEYWQSDFTPTLHPEVKGRG